MSLLVACYDGLLFSDYKSVDAQSWYASDTLVFKLPKVEEDATRDVNVKLRALQTYSYSNMALAVHLVEGQKTVSVDTVRFTIYDKEGKATGAGFPFIEYSSIIKDVHFKADKAYKIKIIHVMRLDPIEGISQVGIEF